MRAASAVEEQRPIPPPLDALADVVSGRHHRLGRVLRPLGRERTHHLRADVRRSPALRHGLLRGAVGVEDSAAPARQQGVDGTGRLAAAKKALPIKVDLVLGRAVDRDELVLLRVGEPLVLALEVLDRITVEAHLVAVAGDREPLRSPSLGLAPAIPRLGLATLVQVLELHAAENVLRHIEVVPQARARVVHAFTPDPR
eukprot:7388478-Prymnesium_polylepis.2